MRLRSLAGRLRHTARGEWASRLQIPLERQRWDYSNSGAIRVSHIVNQLPSSSEVSVPMGPLIDATELVNVEADIEGEAASLLYNEFIVYNTAQVIRSGHFTVATVRLANQPTATYIYSRYE